MVAVVCPSLADEYTVLRSCLCSSRNRLARFHWDHPRHLAPSAALCSWYGVNNYPSPFSTLILSPSHSSTCPPTHTPIPVDTIALCQCKASSSMLITSGSQTFYHCFCSWGVHQAPVDLSGLTRRWVLAPRRRRKVHLQCSHLSECLSPLPAR